MRKHKNKYFLLQKNYSRKEHLQTKDNKRDKTNSVLTTATNVLHHSARKAEYLKTLSKAENTGNCNLLDLQRNADDDSKGLHCKRVPFHGLRTA